MMTFKVGYLIGSLASASINRLLAKALVGLAPPQLSMTEVPFRDLPIYSYDYDADFPPAARAFKSALSSVEAVLFVTPEYNRSIPGGLKMRSTGRADRTDRIPFPASLPRSSGRHPERSAPQSRSNNCEASLVSATRRK